MKNIIKCSECGELHINECDGSWKDWFRFNVEGSFWEVLSWTIKYFVVVFGTAYIIGLAAWALYENNDLRNNLKNAICQN